MTPVPNEMKETGVNPIVTATSKNCDLSNGTTSPTTKSIIELVSPICETLERTSTNDLSCTREYYIDTNSEHVETKKCSNLQIKVSDIDQVSLDLSDNITSQNANIEITNTEINSRTKNICSNNNESYPTDIDNVLQKEGDTEMKEILNNVNQFLNEEQSKETHTTEIEKHGKSPSTGSNIEGDCTLSLCNKFKIDETINDSNCLDININNCSPTVIDNVNSLEEDYTLERPVEKTNPENKKETPIVETSSVLVSNSKLKNDVSEEHKNISTTINSLQKTTNVTEETLPIEETIPENSTCVLDKIASDGEKNVVQVDTNVSEPFTEELEVSSNAQSTSELEKNVSQEEKDDSKVKNDDLEVIGHGSKVKTCDEENNSPGTLLNLDNSRVENNSTEVHTSNTLEDKSVVEDNISKVETSDSPKEVKNEEKEIESNTIGHEKETVEGEYNSQVEILNVIKNVSGSSSETRISTESKISDVAENISHKEILCVEEKVESSCVLNDKLEVSENTNCVDNVPTPIADPCSKNKIVDSLVLNNLKEEDNRQQKRKLEEIQNESLDQKRTKLEDEVKEEDTSQNLANRLNDDTIGISLETNEINHCDSSSIDNETSNILPSTTPTSEEEKILEKKETSTEELDPGEIERIKRVRVVVDPLEDISNPCIKAFAKDDCAQTSQDDECTILFEEIKKPDVPRSRRERVSLTQIVCLSSSSEDEEESDKIRVGSEYQSVVEEFANQPRTGVYASSEDAPEDIAMWKPHHKVEEEQVDTFIKKANQEYNYREDQALGLLYHHKYNFTAAYAELSKYYNLLKKEWSKADKDKFEKLISKHKKNFDIIQVNTHKRRIPAR
ncbi:hypothetical protein M8J75_014112 [Diaphorina citri]|nr:hypothetical protein M8J75_014112 [Diaphorina citri]